MFNSDVFKSWALVLQLGISMIVPILILVAIGYLIKTNLKVDLMLIFVLLGLIVGIRNVYVLLRNYIKAMDKGVKKGSELMKKHMKSIKEL